MAPLVIAVQEILPGERRQIAITLAKLYDFTDMKIPVAVWRGKEDGPTMFVSAAIHGDEINGVDIVRRLLKSKALNKLRGTLIAIPIVNVFGFNDKSRYLPDRRDLNRSFPGERHGSLASQIAYIFRSEIVEKCTHGIDLHTGAIHRRNLPHIRVNLSKQDDLELAKSFGAPVILNASSRDGSLREMVMERNVPTLLYEGGTALRFDTRTAKVGLEGILNVMRNIGWFGFNAGSAITAEGLAAYAFVNTFVAAAVAFLSWMAVDWVRDGKPTAIGSSIGLVVGLVAITPAAGFVDVSSSIAIGAIAALICNYVAKWVKHATHMDDALDVFACHGVGGVVGAVLTGVFATKDVNPGIAAEGILVSGETTVFYANIIGVIAVASFTVVATYIIIKLVSIVTPIRVPDHVEAAGLDHAMHGEHARYSIAKKK